MFRSDLRIWSIGRSIDRSPGRHITRSDRQIATSQHRQMLIPRFWARAEGAATDRDGRKLALRQWGWSQESVAEALALAGRRVAELAGRLSGGATSHQYLYGSRQPLREEILRYLGDEGRGYAVITRNRYGALVLNTVTGPVHRRRRGGAAGARGAEAALQPCAGHRAHAGAHPRGLRPASAPGVPRLPHPLGLPRAGHQHLPGPGLGRDPGFLRRLRRRPRLRQAVPRAGQLSRPPHPQAVARRRAGAAGASIRAIRSASRSSAPGC